MDGIIKIMILFGKQLNEKMADQCLKTTILWGLDARFFYRSEMMGGEEAK